MITYTNEIITYPCHAPISQVNERDTRRLTYHVITMCFVTFTPGTLEPQTRWSMHPHLIDCFSVSLWRPKSGQFARNAGLGKVLWITEKKRKFPAVTWVHIGHTWPLFSIVTYSTSCTGEESPSFYLDHTDGKSLLTVLQLRLFSSLHIHGLTTSRPAINVYSIPHKTSTWVVLYFAFLWS